MTLSENSILILEKVKSWQDSIDKVGSILRNQGKITQTYIEKMKQAVINLGPYMVIMPGFALVHAEPSKDVIETSISLIILKRPVHFNSHNDPVYVVMCLASVDKTSHIAWLSKIANSLMKEGIIEELKTCKNANSVIRCLESE